MTAASDFDSQDKIAPPSRPGSVAGARTSLPDWAQLALARAESTRDEASLLNLVHQAVDHLAALLQGEAPSRFEGLIAFCDAALASPLQAYPVATRRILEVRGVAEAQTFEQTGEMAMLRRGIDDLIGSLDGEPVESSGITSRRLAQAQFRLGEQSGDLAMLRASIDRLRALPPALASEPMARCTCAVAAMTVGGLTSDSQMVERAILDLQALIKEPGLDPQARAVIEQNLAVALLKSAEQYRSERVYKELLEYLAQRLSHRKRTREAEMLRLVQAMARLQFAKISEDRNALRRCELELSRLLQVFAREPRRRLELLHMRGQARFHRAGLTRSTGILAAAIASIEGALALCVDATGRADARHDRLISDLAYYTLQLGLWSDSDSHLREARALFEEALRGTSPERSPWMYIQIGKGLFELHYRQRDFSTAASLADDINRVARLARADPRLTAGVVAQAPLELLGLHERHAWCLVQLERLAEASEVLENGRGLLLAAAARRGAALDSALNAEAQDALNNARISLAAKLRRDSDIAVRRTWEDYLTLRRQHGLDLDEVRRDARQIAAAAPSDGALIQLSFTPAGSFALVWIRSMGEPKLTALPTDAWLVISQILNGPPGGRAWTSAYKQYLSCPADSDALALQADEEWAQVIVECLGEMWRCIWQPINVCLDELGLSRSAQVVICPQGELAQLPLAAAISSSGEVQSDRWDISIAPNALAIHAAQPPAKEALPQLLCLHSPEGEWANDLPMARAEALALRQTVPRMVEVSGARLDAGTVLDLMKSATHLHIACHGEYNESEPYKSALVLAFGERLTLTRLWAAGFERFDVRLVFLSCCEGGVTGRSLDSDEFAGLPAAFLQLGARAVIAAQWAVHDDTARVFSDAFYRRYLGEDGMPRTSPAQALGLTRRWIREATLATLVDEGYLTLEQAQEIVPTRARQTRGLRHPSHAEGGPRPSDSGTHEGLSDWDLMAQPYSLACHWAGWTLFGR